jgi:hypothetical protein
MIFEKKVEVGQFTDDQIKHLLQSLVAKAGLNFDEIVGAHAKRKTKISNNLLDVHKDSTHSTYMCGSSPAFTASVVDENGKCIAYPEL